MACCHPVGWRWLKFYPLVLIYGRMHSFMRWCSLKYRGLLEMGLFIGNKWCDAHEILQDIAGFRYEPNLHFPIIFQFVGYFPLSFSSLFCCISGGFPFRSASVSSFVCGGCRYDYIRIGILQNCSTMIAKWCFSKSDFKRCLGLNYQDRAD